MPKLLLVEDSKLFARLVHERVEGPGCYEIVHTVSYEETRELLDDENHDIFAALLDLHLPDAPHGEIVDLVVSKGVPSIIFTAEISDDIRELVWSKEIVDYVVKSDLTSLDNLVKLLDRLRKNQDTAVLVVDDSRVSRTSLSRLLRMHRFQVLEAPDGQTALDKLAQNPNVRLVITDYNMPQMDGFELTTKIRELHPRERLAVIGISATGSPILSARFIKNGANDFLSKPFVNEEFYCRVYQNVELQEYIETIRHLSNADPLTGLSNRRHFFDAARGMLARATAEKKPVALAIIDLDHFKRVNDTHGHDAGDTVLRHVAQLFSDRFRSCDSCGAIASRFGGEEFCIFLTGHSPERARELVDGVRAQLSERPVSTAKGEVSVTLSAGLCCESGQDLETLIRRADELLYAAKKFGRDRVEVG